MTSEGLGEKFEGDSEDTLAGKFPLVSMEGQAESLACADPVGRTPIGASGIYKCSEDSGWFIREEKPQHSISKVNCQGQILL